MTKTRRSYGLLAGIFMVMLVLTALFAFSAGVSADIASGTWGTASWKITDDHTLVFYGNGQLGVVGNYESRPWHSQRDIIEAVKVEGNVLPNPDLNYLLYDCRNLKTVDFSGFSSTVPVTKVTNLICTFNQCPKLKTINLGSLDLSQLTYAWGMCHGCESLTSITPTEYFVNCIGNVQINNGSSTISRAALYAIFGRCESLSLDLSQVSFNNLSGKCESMLAGIGRVKLGPNTFPYAVSAEGEFYAWPCYADLSSSIKYYRVEDGQIKHADEISALSGSEKAGTWILCKDGSLSGVPSGTAQWSFDAATGELVFEPADGATTGTLGAGVASEIANLKDQVTSVVVKPGVKLPAEGCPGLFQNFSACTSFDLSGLDTSAATDFKNMFNGCSGVDLLDISGFDMSSATNVTNMLGGVKGVTFGTGFDVSGVPAASRNFANPTGTYVQVTHNGEDVFKNSTPTSAANLRDMSAADREGTWYVNAPNLAGGVCGDNDSVRWYVTSWGRLVIEPVDGVEGTMYMLYGVTTPWGEAIGDDLSLINEVEVRSTVFVRNPDNMFLKLYKVKSMDLSGLQLSDDSTETTQMFEMSDWSVRNPPELKSLDISHFNTQGIVDMSNMFLNLTHSVEVLDLRNFDTSSVTTMLAMFQDNFMINQSGYSGPIPVSVYDNKPSALRILDVSSFNTEQCADFMGMFMGLNSLSSLDVRNFDTQQAASSIINMFDGVHQFTLGKKFYSTNTSHAIAYNGTTYYRMTYLDENGEEVDMSSYSLANEPTTVEAMRNMTNDQLNGTWVWANSGTPIHWVKNAVGGKVILHPANPAEGEQFTLEAFPDENYALQSVTVAGFNEGTLPTDANGRYTMPAGGIVVDASFDGYDPNQEAADAVIAKINAIGTPITLAKKAQIEEAEAEYAALSGAAKALVTNYSDLTAARSALNALQAGVDNAIAKIDALAQYDTITAANVDDAKAAAAAARAALEGLTEEQLAAVGEENVAKIGALENAIQVYEDEAAFQQQIDDVKALIAAIGDVTLASEEAINAARIGYEALNDEQKALVDNYATLTDAETALAELKAGVQNAKDKIAALAQYDPITSTNAVAAKAAAQAAKDAVAGLTEEQKDAVGADELAKIDAFDAKIAAYDKAVADQAAADAVKAQINAIGNVTLAKKDAIEAARAAYGDLTDDQKALVDNLAILEDAEESLATLEAGVQNAIDKINALDLYNPITAENIDEAKAAAQAAKDAYNALNAEQKRAVGEENYNKIGAFEQQIAAEEGNLAVENVIALINDIGDVTLSSEPKIEAAETAYGALTNSQKDAVTNYSKLVAAKQTLERKKGEVTSTIAKIDEIGNPVTLADEGKIEAARTAYTGLDDEQKDAITNYGKLQQAEADLAVLKGRAAIDDVIAKINAIGKPATYGKKAEIDAARAAYEALSNTQKDQVTNYGDLTAAEELWPQLQAQVDDAIAKIHAVPVPDAISLNDLEEAKAAATTARAAYDALDDDQKEAVGATNLSRLMAAETKIAALEKDVQDEQKAQEIKGKIEVLPDHGEIGLGSDPADLENIQNVIDEYDALDDNVKGKLTDEEKQKIEDLRNKLALIEEAKEVQDLIDQLPAAGEITNDTKETVQGQINDIEEALTGISDEAKELLDQTKLNEAKEKIAQLNNPDTIDVSKIVNVKTGAEITVAGNVMTVRCADACAVGYTTDGGKKYNKIAAVANGDGSYSFTIPEGVSSENIAIVKKGDVSGDGKFSTTDKNAVAQHMKKEITLSGTRLLAADLNGDGRIANSEKNAIKQRVSKTVTAFAW